MEDYHQFDNDNDNDRAVLNTTGSINKLIFYFHQKLKLKLTLFKRRSTLSAKVAFLLSYLGLEEQSTKFTDHAVNQVLIRPAYRARISQRQKLVNNLSQKWLQILCCENLQSRTLKTLIRSMWNMLVRSLARTSHKCSLRYIGQRWSIQLQEKQFWVLYMKRWGKKKRVGATSWWAEYIQPATAIVMSTMQQSSATSSSHI